MSSDIVARSTASRAWRRKGWRWFWIGASMNIVTIGTFPIQLAVKDAFWSWALVGVTFAAIAVMLTCFWRQHLCNRRALKVWTER